MLAVGLVLMGVGPTIGSLDLLGVGIFLNGVAVALGNVPLNVESARIERAMGRTVIPQFHAAFSIGAVTGSALGATASHLGVSVTAQFAAVAVLAVVWRLASLRGVVLADAPGDRRPSRARGRHARRRGHVGLRRRIASSLDSWREPRTLLIGVVIMAAALSEGSANDWLSLAVVDGFDQTEAVGGAMLGVFVGAMTLVRLLGTRLIDRFGRVPVLRVSGVVSIVGLLLFGFAPSLVLGRASASCCGASARRSPCRSASPRRPTTRCAPPAGSPSCRRSPRSPRSRPRRCSASPPPRPAPGTPSCSSRSRWWPASCSPAGSPPSGCRSRTRPNVLLTTSRSSISPTPTRTRTARSPPGTPTT